jgi:Glycosyl transferases group 1
VNGAPRGGARTDEVPAPSTWTVAVEVSALHGGSHTATEFIAFAVAALRNAVDISPTEWSVRRLRRAERATIRLRHRARARLGERAAVLGLPLSARWATPGAQVAYLASGPLALRVTPPGLVTVLHLDAANRDAPRRRRLDRLARAVADGVVLHVPTNAAADALADILRVDRASIAVAAPGVRVPHAPAPPLGSSPGAILVLEGDSASKDLAVLEALRAAGAPAQIAVGPGATPEPACCVLASPSAVFPIGALEAMAAGTAVVATRSPTTTELLEGAARLVDAGTPKELADAAMELHTNQAARAIAVAAGRARAGDFTWASRSGDLLDLVRRSLAVRGP